MGEKKLTIVITTYNRKTKLIAQLKSIFRQPLYCELNIIISDNCSNYDLKDTLKCNFSPHELTFIEIIERPFNIGMIGNISNSFLLPKTRWMWLLSDDDETTIDSIETIFNFINLYPDISAFKFTRISDAIKMRYEQQNVESISQLLKFCKKNEIDLGNFIFMSNNVYNMDLIRPYLGSAFKYSYSYFPHIIPILSALDNNLKLKFIQSSVVNYKDPEIPPASDYFVSIYLGASSICDIPFNILENDFKELRNYFKMNPFWIISNDFYNCSYPQKRYLYGKLYKSMFKVDNSFSNSLVYRLFCFQIFIGSNFLSTSYLNLKRQIKKIITLK